MTDQWPVQPVPRDHHRPAWDPAGSWLLVAAGAWTACLAVVMRVVVGV